MESLLCTFSEHPSTCHPRLRHREEATALSKASQRQFRLPLPLLHLHYLIYPRASWYHPPLLTTSQATVRHDAGWLWEETLCTRDWDLFNTQPAPAALRGGGIKHWKVTYIPSLPPLLPTSSVLCSEVDQGASPKVTIPAPLCRHRHRSALQSCGKSLGKWL